MYNTPAYRRVYLSNARKFREDVVIETGFGTRSEFSIGRIFACFESAVYLYVLMIPRLFRTYPGKVNNNDVDRDARYRVNVPGKACSERKF